MYRELRLGLGLVSLFAELLEGSRALAWFEGLLV